MGLHPGGEGLHAGGSASGGGLYPGDTPSIRYHGIQSMSGRYHPTRTHSCYCPQGNIFRSVCQEFCSQGGGVVSQHALQVT